MKKLICTICILTFTLVSSGISVKAYDNVQALAITRNTKIVLNISNEDKLELENLLSNYKKTNSTVVNNSNMQYIHIAALATPAIPAAVTATYFIPGIGDIALLATGAIVLGGVTYYAGSWAYDKIMPYIIAYSIPSRLKKDGKTVNLGKFNQKVRGRQAYKESGGWTIEKDTAGHGGSKWKLKKPNGERTASLDGNGKVLRK
ncbi:hypothetical protein [Clostridium tyrobutyricum]|uniref:hypothetical protein n=1 Tax=Clostridium tyrobutyricum TaxID=1519 RepID=UPI00068E1249|nr:hypothetical protein [Clostridium tyrobutyricum]